MEFEKVQCQEKTCLSCQVLMPLSVFRVLKHYPSGKPKHDSRCVECRRKEARERMAALREAGVVKKWRAANRDKINALKTKYRRVRGAVDRKAAKDHRDALQAERYAASFCAHVKEFERAQKPWLKDGLSKAERYKIRYAKDLVFRQSQILKNGKRKKILKERSDGPVNVQALIQERDRCPYCFTRLHAENTAIDHMEPISKGGIHAESNLIACCKSCNNKKHAKPFNQWVNQLPVENKWHAVSELGKKMGFEVLSVALVDHTIYNVSH